MAINQHRKLQLLKILQETLLIELPESVMGNQSLAQEMINRIESIVKTRDEFNFSVDAVAVLLEKSKGAEIQIIGKSGVRYSRQDLAKLFGIFLKPKPKR